MTNPYCLVTPSGTVKQKPFILSAQALADYNHALKQASEIFGFELSLKDKVRHMAAYSQHYFNSPEKPWDCLVCLPNNKDFNIRIAVKPCNGEIEINKITKLKEGPGSRQLNAPPVLVDQFEEGI